MTALFRKALLVTVFSFFIYNSSEAQRKGNFINATIGYGISTSFDATNPDIYDGGFYAQGEYVFGFKKWFDVRPYAGFIFTSQSSDNKQQGYKVTTNAFMLGGKARLTAPIPWFAPFVEIGIGASIGSFITEVPGINEKKNGIVPHIPFSLGLALGPKHNVEIAFTYYVSTTLEQFSGAAAFGLSIPINN